MEAVIAHIDGASRGNPGDAGYGVQICAPDGSELVTFGDYLGRQTNNYAEYSALLAVLGWAERHGVRDLAVRSDSELVVKQMRGEYRVKSDSLRPLFEQARVRAARLPRFRLEHVPRSRNKVADRLANLAIDARGPVQD